MIETKNAVIESAELTIEGRGLLSGWLHLSYGGEGQGFGGISLYLPKSFKHHNIQSPAGHWIFRCLEIAGVERWSQLKGKTIRVKTEMSKCHAIGHIVNDDWFDPSKDFNF